jgi:gas vesicle protein
MRRLLLFLGGILSGGAFGTALALLFTPNSGASMRGDLRTRYENALKAGEAAAQLKRVELEQQLAVMTSPPPAGLSLSPVRQPPAEKS